MTYPIVVHCQEEHKRQRQQVIMRVVKQAKTALERQIRKSVAIDTYCARAPNSCLNLKSELKLSKIYL